MELPKDIVHWVRVAGSIYSTRAVGMYSRGENVLCRTQRGVEMGQILAALRIHPNLQAHADSIQSIQFLRRARQEDNLLWNQLKMLGEDACAECQAYLSKSGSQDILLEVEPLLDGRTIYFHFLGTPTTQTEDQVQLLTEVYQQRVARSPLGKKLENSQGSKCCTDKESGCGTGNCNACDGSKRPCAHS